MKTKLAIGARAERRRVFSAPEVEQFANLSGDRNPIHLDPEYASNSRFKRPVVHGVLATSTVSALLAEELPGPGTILLELNLRFLRPIYVGEEMLARVEIQKIRDDKPIVELSIECLDLSGSTAIVGDSVVLVDPVM